MLNALLSLVIAQAAAVTAPTPLPPVIREIARGVYLAPDSDYEGLGPNGNSVLFTGSGGIVVVDTGRHDWHTNALIAFAEQHGKPITAMVNTHVHLDHSSGNYRIKARYPGAILYASDAFERALTTGFLSEQYTLGRTRWENERETLAPERRERLRAFLDVMENLRPDAVIERSQRMRLGGRGFDVHLARNAVTDGDVWLYDRRSRVAVLGDLVTLPAPYLDTACPDGWRAALAEIEQTPFRIAVPGHGGPMSRADVALYARAMNTFLDCVATDATAEQCAAIWAEAAAPLLWEGSRAVEYAAEYVPYLRENGGRAPDCQAPR